MPPPLLSAFVFFNGWNTDALLLSLEWSHCQDAYFFPFSLKHSFTSPNPLDSSFLRFDSLFLIYWCYGTTGWPFQYLFFLWPPSQFFPSADQQRAGKTTPFSRVPSFPACLLSCTSPPFQIFIGWEVNYLF